MKTREEIEKIYWKLASSGSGKSPAEFVLQDDDLFHKYNKWVKEGMSDIDIALRVQDEWISRNPNATQNDLDPSQNITVAMLAGSEKNPSEEQRQKLIDFRFKREQERSSS